MRIVPFAPREELASLVSSVAIVEAREPAEFIELPETGIVLGMRYAGSATLLAAGSSRVIPDHSVTGLRSTARRVRTSAGGLVVVKLRPLAARAFLPEPIHLLYGATRPLEDFVPAAVVADVSARVAHADGDAERVAVFQQFLIDHRSRREPDPVVAEALRVIGQDPGGVRIGTLAMHVEVSQDALARRFRRVVGMPPKAYASLLQLRRACDAFPRARPTLGELAIRAGFCDQSHFIRRFRAVAGAPPGQVLLSDEYCSM